MIERLKAAVKRNKVKVGLAILLTTITVALATRGEKITAAFGGMTAAMGAFGFSDWSILIGIVCTIATSISTVVINWTFKKREFELRKQLLREQTDEAR